MSVLKALENNSISAVLYAYHTPHRNRCQRDILIKDSALDSRVSTLLLECQVGGTPVVLFDHFLSSTKAMAHQV